MHNNYKSKAPNQSMQAERIFFLNQEIENDPGEPFNYYALALEYLKENKEKSEELFDLLLQKFPEYLPTYYQAANFFFETEKYQKAEVFFKTGIDLAQKQGKSKALAELKGSYQIFLDEIEE